MIAAHSPALDPCKYGYRDKITNFFLFLPLAFLRHIFSNCIPLLTVSQPWGCRWRAVLLRHEEFEKHPRPPSLPSWPLANSLFCREGKYGFAQRNIPSQWGWHFQAQRKCSLFLFAVTTWHIPINNSDLITSLTLQVRRWIRLQVRHGYNVQFLKVPRKDSKSPLQGVEPRCESRFCNWVGTWMWTCCCLKSQYL